MLKCSVHTFILFFKHFFLDFLIPRRIRWPFLCITSTISSFVVWIIWLIPCSLCCLFIWSRDILSQPSFILHIIIGPTVFPKRCSRQIFITMATEKSTLFSQKRSTSRKHFAENKIRLIQACRVVESRRDVDSLLLSLRVSCQQCITLRQSWPIRNFKMITSQSQSERKIRAIFQRPFPH